jgi:HAD superfamily phosphatase (TIGR01668 family)
VADKDAQMALISPSQTYPSVEAIPVEELRRHGYRAVLMDIDNTLVPRSTGQIPPSVPAWVRDLRQSGLPCCLISNNWHKTVFAHAEALGLPVVYRAMKPAPFAYRRALKKINAEKRGAVIIGDQLFTDVLGARLSGIDSILVEPRSNSDLWYTKIFRRIERILRRK